MTRFEYDEEASAEWRMDVVYEIRPEEPTRASWVDVQRALNAVNDPLARKLLRLHRDCGSQTGVCVRDDELADLGEGWACETTALIAEHFGIGYPGEPNSSDI